METIFIEQAKPIEEDLASRNKDTTQKLKITAKEQELFETAGTLLIGDIKLNVPPTSMYFSWVNQSSAIPTIRTEGDAVISYNNHIPRVTLTLYFNGEDSINNELRPLIAMFKYMPFSTIRNTTIFDAWISRKDLTPLNEDLDRTKPVSCYLENITFNTIPGFPNSVQATLSITNINKLPYSLSNRMWTSWDNAEKAAKWEARIHAMDSTVISAKPSGKDIKIDVLNSSYEKYSRTISSTPNSIDGAVHGMPDANDNTTTIFPENSKPFVEQYQYKLSEKEYKGNFKNNEAGATYFWPKYSKKHNNSLFLTYQAPAKFDTPYTVFADRLSSVNEAATRLQSIAHSLATNAQLLDMDSDFSIFEDFDAGDLLSSYVEYMTNIFSFKPAIDVANKIWRNLARDWAESFSSISTKLIFSSATDENNIQSLALDGSSNLEEAFSVWDNDKGTITHSLSEAIKLMWGDMHTELERLSTANQDKLPSEWSENDRDAIDEMQAFMNPLLNTLKFSTAADLFPNDPSSPLNYNSVAIQFEWNDTFDPGKHQRHTLKELTELNTHKSFDGTVIAYHAPSVIDSISYSFGNNATPYFLNSSNLPVYQHMGIASASASMVLRTRDERLHKLIGDMSASTQEVGAQLMRGNYKLSPYGSVALTGNLQGLETGRFSGHLLNSVGFNFANIRNVSSRSIDGHPGWWEVSIDFIENTQNLRRYERLQSTKGVKGSLPLNIEYLKNKFFPTHLTQSAPMEKKLVVSSYYSNITPYYGESSVVEQEVPSIEMTLLQDGEDISIKLPSYLYADRAKQDDIKEISIEVFGVSPEKKEKKENFITNMIAKGSNSVVSTLSSTLKDIAAWENNIRGQEGKDSTTVEKYSITEIYSAYCKDFLSQLVYTLRDVQQSHWNKDHELLTQADIDFSFPSVSKKRIIDFTRNTFYIQSLFLDNLITDFMYTLIRHKDFRRYLDELKLDPKSIEQVKLDGLTQALTELETRLDPTSDDFLQITEIPSLSDSLSELQLAVEAQETVVSISPSFIEDISWSEFLENVNKGISSNFPDLNLPDEAIENTGHKYISPYFPFVHDDPYLEIMEMHKAISTMRLHVLYQMAALRSNKHRERYSSLLDKLYSETGNENKEGVEDEEYFTNISEDKLLSKLLKQRLTENGINIEHRMSAFLEDGKVSFKNMHRFSRKFTETFNNASEDDERLLSAEISKEKLMKLMASTAIMEFLVTLVNADLHLSEAYPSLINKKEELAIEVGKRQRAIATWIRRNPNNKLETNTIENMDEHEIVINDSLVRIQSLQKEIDVLVFNLASSKNLNLSTPEDASNSLLSVMKNQFELTETERLTIEEDSRNGAQNKTQRNDAFLQLIGDKLKLAKSMNTIAETGDWASFLDFFGVGNLESEKAKADLLKTFQDNLQTKRKATMSRAFPTFKIFFIEEDNNTWHAFDDFYSYDAVHDISIVESKHAASKTAILKLSNVTGNLLRADLEGLFSEKDSWGSIPNDAMRIKVGAEIMILVGYGPDYRHLRMKFKGAVTELSPGPIIELTAQSWGAGLLNKVGSEAVTTYSSVIGATSLGSAVIDILSQTSGIGKLGGWTIRASDLNDPSKISATSFKNIYYARALNAMSTWMGDIIPVQSNVRDILGGYLDSEGNGLPFTSTGVFKEYRNNNTIVSLLGNTLYDNIMINTTSTDGYGFWNFLDNTVSSLRNIRSLDFSSVGFQWHVVRQSAWDALHEVALFLGDYIVTTLPFNEGADLFSEVPRETLYFGPRDGYYKKTSRVPRINTSMFLQNINADLVDNKLVQILTNTPIAGTLKVGDHQMFHPDTKIDENILELSGLKARSSAKQALTEEQISDIKIFDSIVDIGKRILSNSLHQSTKSIDEDATFAHEIKDSWAKESHTSELYFNFKENLILNGFTNTLGNLNMLLIQEGSGTLPTTYTAYDEKGGKATNAVGAAGVAGAAAVVVWLSVGGIFITAIVGAAVYVFLGDVAADYTWPDGRVELINPKMNIATIHEILLNDFNRKYYPKGAKTGYSYTSEDLELINKLQLAEISGEDIATYNSTDTAFYKRHKNTDSALTHILAMPGSLTSSPAFNLDTADPFMVFSTQKVQANIRGNDIFWNLYGTYFQKQDIMIFVDTVNFLRKYYNEVSNTQSIRTYNTNPRMFDLDSVMIDLFGTDSGSSLVEGAVVQQHSINSYEDIIENGIIATADQMYNHVELLYPGEPDPEANPSNARNRAFAYYSYDLDPDFLRSYQTYQKNLDPNIFLDKTAADVYVAESKLRTDTDNKLSEAFALTPHRVANHVLMNVMRPMYQGTLTILGNPNIKPWDIVHIHDDTTQMYGPIEVEQVVTSISAAGYTTTIIPNALIYHNSVGAALSKSALGLLSQIQTMSTIWTAIKWAALGVITVGAHSVARSSLRDKIQTTKEPLTKLKTIFGLGKNSKMASALRGATGTGSFSKNFEFFDSLDDAERKILKGHASSTDFAQLDKQLQKIKVGTKKLNSHIELLTAKGAKNVSKNATNKFLTASENLVNEIDEFYKDENPSSVKRRVDLSRVKKAHHQLNVDINIAKKAKANTTNSSKRRQLDDDIRKLQKKMRKTAEEIHEIKYYRNIPKDELFKIKEAQQRVHSRLQAKVTELRKIQKEIADVSRKSKKRKQLIKEGRKLKAEVKVLKNAVTKNANKARKEITKGRYLDRRIVNAKLMNRSLRKSITTSLGSGLGIMKFGMRALNWTQNALLIYEGARWLWDTYEASAKSSILQANLLAGSNALTILPLEHPAGKDYVAGLEGIIGTTGSTSQVVMGFRSSGSNRRSILVQDIIMRNSEIFN